MKHYLQILPIILLFTSSITEADEYVWGEEFEEGDIISAETFNQIFDTLQKLNRTPIDADLVGTWSCSAVEKSSNAAQNISGWSQQGFLWVLLNKQVTLTSSSSATSLESPYSLSTSAPSPFYITTDASTGTYIIYKGMLFVKGVSSTDGIDQYNIDIVSNDRFTLQGITSGGYAVPDFIVCDSAIAVPAAPTATTATNNQTTVTVTWTDQSSDETGFTIYRRLSTETEATQLVTAITASPYVDSSLTEGQTAYYSVAAYNDNGVSAKSKIVSATLDSIKPTVSSHSPISNQEVLRDNRALSITFSENIKVICPTGDGVLSCSTSGSAITAVGSSGKTYGYITLPGATGLSISGNIVGSAELLNAGDDITVTVHKDWITDANGVPMAADYTYTFSVGLVTP